MTDDAPPLLIWVFPILLTSIILISFFSYCYSSYGPYREVVALSNKNLEEQLTDITQDTSALSIVVVGSSLTEHAFEGARKVQDSIGSHTHKKTKLLRLSLNFMSVDIATRIDLYGHLCRHAPDYLFIENFCFNIDHADSLGKIDPPVDAALLKMRNYVRGAIGKDTTENYYIKWYTFDIPPPAEFYSATFDSATFKALQKKICVSRKPAKNETINSLLDTLTRKNTRVVFLDMPQSIHQQANFLDSSATAKHREVLNFYKTQYHIDYWAYPSVMHDSCFVDGIHMNYIGAKQYEEWFVSEVSSKEQYEAAH